VQSTEGEIEGGAYDNPVSAHQNIPMLRRRSWVREIFLRQGLNSSSLERAAQRLERSDKPKYSNGKLA
jgi:hypothetical protein